MRPAPPALMMLVGLTWADAERGSVKRRLDDPLWWAGRIERQAKAQRVHRSSRAEARGQRLSRMDAAAVERRKMVLRMCETRSERSVAAELGLSTARVNQIHRRAKRESAEGLY